MVNKEHKESGFSLIELLVVLIIAATISAIAIMSFSWVRIHKADAQTANLIDIFQEARQRSISQRATMRVEINRTRQQIQIIDEGRNTLNAADDVVIKTVSFIGDGVTIGLPPSNQITTPTELTPTPQIAFATSVHPLSLGNNTATLRFLRNGTVTNAGTDAIGTGSTATGATIYVWQKYETDKSANPTIGQVFRAVTVISSTGLSRVWKCGSENGLCVKWTK